MSKNEFEFEDELLKSIEKLVEEETSVAKATVNSDTKYNIPRQNAAKTVVSDENLGKTRMINSEEIKDSAKQVLDKTVIVPSLSNERFANVSNADLDEEDDLDDILDDDYELEDEELLLDAPFQRKSAKSDNGSIAASKNDNTKRVSGSNNAKSNSYTNKPNQNNKINYKLIIGAAAVVVVVVAVIVIIAVNSSNNKKKSYKYNYDTGINYYNSMDYANAKTYLEKAYNTSEGKRSTEVMFALYECYVQENDMARALEILDSVLAYDKQNERALKAKAEYYFNNKDGAALTELLKIYRTDTVAYGFVSQYDVVKPLTKQEETNFNNKFELELEAPEGCSIYYTTDGSEPTAQSTLYNAKIVVEGEDNVIKAVAINEIGVVSEVAEFSYKISYLNPEGPIFDIEKAEVEIGTKILITNIPENAKAYYTIDGTTPTAEATLYTDGIVLSNEGNTVVSAIIISEHNKSSQIVRRSYKVKQPKTYTFAEAKQFLISRMQALNVLKSDGSTLTSGGTINIVYQAKETVGDIELYYVRIDSTTGGTTGVYGYYGIGIKDGKCYKVTGNSGSYKAVEY